jgi:hypothetical protein
VQAAAPLSFEIGPIRPPNEADSLLVRVTRNCPWNKCAFCPVYKGAKFSPRPTEDVEADIDAMAELARRLADRARRDGGLSNTSVHAVLREAGSPEGGVQVARFVLAGGRTAFLQDANSLVLKPERLARILRRLRAAFPTLERVTTYARSQTATKRSVEQLRSLREAGLDRVHIGLESGSDRVLELVHKGTTAAQHIEGGLRIKEAGLCLSEYVMPGLGGRALSAEHAEETSRVLRAIDPHFIRLRSLAATPRAEIGELVRDGTIELLGDVDVVREIRATVAGFEGMTGQLASDHILNLLEGVQGQLPGDLRSMLALIDRFLELPDGDRDLFVVGRRIGLMRDPNDLLEPGAREHARVAMRELRVRFPGPVDRALQQLLSRFV